MNPTSLSEFVIDLHQQLKLLMERYTCHGCGKLLEMTSLALRTCDGCPCNSPRGINHGIVAKEVCTCAECDPKQLGASRIRDYYETLPLTEKADAPANCQHCDGSGHYHGWPGVISSPCKFCNGTGKRSEP